MTDYAPIPQPKPDPIIRNLRDIDPRQPVQTLMRLAEIHGPIYRLELPGRSMTVVSSRELVNEVCDENRFGKVIHTVLDELRALAGDGLFTAHTHEPNWGKAHRILMPAFGPMPIRGMFDKMLDIADQMLVRWERFGESAVIDVADQMTRLTLDTIALCAFDYRFNSFYQNEMHPFIDAMVDGLAEAGARSRRPDIANRVMMSSSRRYADDIHLMHSVADELIAERKRDPNAAHKKDLLNRMLDVRDPQTGETLSDENIRYQMVTFLIAGHETTSGLLSFAIYLLLKNPEVLNKARATVDRVLGEEVPRPEHRPGLRYVEQVLMETLRLWPTAPAFGVRPFEDTVIGGRYKFTTRDVAMVLIPALHRDRKVWGDDVEDFRPERFDPEQERKLPANAWKPFGNGQRACIGRPFAMQEALLVLSMILQRFDLVEDDPSYELKIKETLTLKPHKFRIRAKLRGTASTWARSRVPTAPQKTMQPASAPAPVAVDGSTPLLVLYGSNTGSSEAFAQRIANEAPAHGYSAEIAPLDERTGQLPKEGAVVIVTASYEGEPPDNADQFVAWLDELDGNELEGVKYTVFGCGNRQWVRTYQRIPTLVDKKLEAAGARRLKARGEADAAGDFFGQFETWYADLWSELAAAFGKKEVAAGQAKLNVEVAKGGRSSILRQADLQVGEIVENRELVDTASTIARSKRHIEIKLPEGVSYRTADYLAVLPRNSNLNVERALRRFGFAPDSLVTVETVGDSVTSLPTGYPISVFDLLANYIELTQPATQRQVEALAAAAQCPPEKKELESLAGEAYESEVLDKRMSVLDLLERFQTCELPFATYLEMMPPLRVRQYSISSSPLWNPDHCTLTVAVVDAPALSGQGHYLGVASTYLSAASPGTPISVAVRPASPNFRPPQDLETPMILICAGSGIAPFRGFLQERALKAEAGQKVGRSILFFGCVDADLDFLYRDELAEWEKAGVVEVRPAFSNGREGEARYVQDRVWAERDEVRTLFEAGANVYLCGDGERMAPAVRDTLIRIYREATRATDEQARDWAEKMQREHGRYVEDIFA